MRQRQTGFSLIELLIVVAIILIIAAIAIPSYLRSRLMANEASTAESLRTINTAEVAYSTSYGIGFAPLANLGGPVGAVCVASSATSCILDSLLSSGTRSGYAITTATPAAVGTVTTPNANFSVSAVPMVLGQTGQRSFCSDQTGVIRADPAGAAPPNPCDSGAFAAIQ
ncbi:MAG: pili assembly chaperone [Acidobacteria bacterium]|nr:MAG: pili assembly chaperone [Acidobacteriota bacterium]